MKILTILGTRPEIIRLSRIIPKLDKYSDHVIVHTGQNYDYELDKIFFNSLRIRKPDYYLGARGTFAKQIATIFEKLEGILIKEKPDRFLVLGDTNSGLGGVVAKRLMIPVFHMEAGNRCYDVNVPEEVNRRIIDHSSSILLPYSNRSCENLISEGIPRSRIYVIGNPIYEVIKSSQKKINSSKILKKLKLKKNSYFLLTLHRQENVDDPKQLFNFIKLLNVIIKKYSNKNIIWPIHPRTMNLLNSLKINLDKKIILSKPLNFFDFVKLENNSFCVLTDSGTVQEECSILKVPCIVLRNSTERQETVESGAVLINYDKETSICRNIQIAVENKKKDDSIPSEYLLQNVSNRVINIILGHHNFQFNG
jgi:UDP-N-acetylglucosamine 2-epimerase (non-hydrolysing)